MAVKTPPPTEKFVINTGAAFLDIEGKPLAEPGPDGNPRTITLGIVLVAAVNSDTKADGVTLDVLDRLTLAQRFRKGSKCEIKVSTCEQIKKLVRVHFAHSPILAGQALIMLGVEPNEDL